MIANFVFNSLWEIMLGPILCKVTFFCSSYLCVYSCKPSCLLVPISHDKPATLRNVGSAFAYPYVWKEALQHNGWAAAVEEAPGLRSGRHGVHRCCNRNSESPLNQQIQLVMVSVTMVKACPALPLWKDNVPKLLDLAEQQQNKTIIKVHIK